jgi:hypothetical protein
LQELTREGKKSNSTRATLSIVMYFLVLEEQSCCVVFSIIQRRTSEEGLIQIKHQQTNIEN